MPYVGSRSPFTVTSSDGRGPDDDAEQEEGPPHSSRLNRPSSPSRMNPPPVPFPTAFPATLISATSAKSTSRPMQHALSSNRIILSNGRSLRSSLMSISSSPLSDDKSSSVSRDSRPGYSRTRSLPTYGHKNVHFKEKEEGLESVRLFRFKGKPISVSKPTLNTETESEVTESESSFPPNHFGPSTSLSEIADCSPIPACPSPYANVHLESVTLLPCRPQVLQGTVLVRNIVYEKDVSARFTLDDWTTVSEVLAAYTGPVAAMETLAGSNQGKTVEDLVGPSKASGWDRFNFAIKLEDHESSIWRHTLFLTIRYSAPGVGEFWDNNSGKNYRINFRACGSPAQPEPRRIPSLTLLPISQTQTIQRSASSPILATNTAGIRFNLRHYAAPAPSPLSTTQTSPKTPTPAKHPTHEKDGVDEGFATASEEVSAESRQAHYLHLSSKNSPPAPVNLTPSPPPWEQGPFSPTSERFSRRSASGAADSSYTALVHEWCFARGSRSIGTGSDSDRREPECCATGR